MCIWVSVGLVNVSKMKMFSISFYIIMHLNPIFRSDVTFEKSQWYLNKKVPK